MPERSDKPTVILLIEDDHRLVVLVQQLLTTSGYEVCVAESAAQARPMLAQQPPQLILLDLMLPDADGLVLLGTLKALSQAPIVILSARSEQVDRVLGLKLGADDFIAKPFDPEELLVRIEAVLRRTRPRPQPEVEHPDQLQVGQLRIARGGGPARLRGQPIHLTPTEHRLLLALADHADEVVARATLLQGIWGYAEPGADHVIDVHLARLRLKLSRGGVGAPIIVTVRGQGLKLVSQPATPGAADDTGGAARGGSPHGLPTLA
jgi:DNA-binding response OmpR family regulator